MRICIDASPAVHHRAGLGRYAQELATALLDIDSENDYVAFYNRPSDAHVDPPLDRLPHLTTNLPAKPWRMSALVAHFARISQDRLFPGIDLFHATDHLLPRLTRLKSVFTLHDLVFRFYPHTHKPLNRWFLTLMMPRFLKAADAVIAVSESTKRDAIRIYGIDEGKVTVIYEGVSQHFRRASPEAISAARHKYSLPDQFLLSVGTIEPRKNLTSLLEAYHTLKSEGLPLGLVIVGKKGWLYSGFFNRMHELGLDSAVAFPGFVPDEDLPALYSAADLFVFPSLYEGFGLPVLESLACGTPVVASNASSLPEVAGEAAILVDPRSVEALVRAVKDVLGNRELREDLRERGPKQAARFNWQRAARETLAVYTSLAGE